MGRVFTSPAVVFNAFYLLTYPLTAVTTVAVARRFGLSGPAAVTAGVLYAFQPYHYLRGQTHYFLAAYYVIPLAVMLMLDLCLGRLPFFPHAAGGGRRFSLRDRDTVVAGLVALATSAAGAYYAFFTCALLMAAGLYGAVKSRSAAALASAALVTGVVVLGGVANHLPTFLHQARYGQNSRPHTRLAEEAELYGMKMAQLLLPVVGHNPVSVGTTVFFDPAALRSAYQAPLFKELNETDWDPLGLVGACGYVGLLAAGFLPVRRGRLLGPLSALAVFSTLLGTVGGFGAVFNLVLSPQVRCYNRLSIFVAFFAVLAACRAADLAAEGGRAASGGPASRCSRSSACGTRRTTSGSRTSASPGRGTRARWTTAPRRPPSTPRTRPFSPASKRCCPRAWCSTTRSSSTPRRGPTPSLTPPKKRRPTSTPWATCTLPACASATGR